jgi:hypothetical protein
LYALWFRRSLNSVSARPGDAASALAQPAPAE